MRPPPLGSGAKFTTTGLVTECMLELDMIVDLFLLGLVWLLVIGCLGLRVTQLVKQVKRGVAFLLPQYIPYLCTASGGCSIIRVLLSVIVTELPSVPWLAHPTMHTTIARSYALTTLDRSSYCQFNSRFTEIAKGVVFVSVADASCWFLPLARPSSCHIPIDA